MAKRNERSIVAQFEELPDPRALVGVRHSLEAILTIALCGVLCGADTWVDIEGFGAAKADWFATFLDLPHGIPSYDTFGRVFSALDPEQFEACFRSWTQGIAGALGAQVIALDGQYVFSRSAGASVRSQLSSVTVSACPAGTGSRSGNSR